jgi:hypothetical protein
MVANRNRKGRHRRTNFHRQRCQQPLMRVPETHGGTRQQFQLLAHTAKAVACSDACSKGPSTPLGCPQAAAAANGTVSTPCVFIYWKATCLLAVEYLYKYLGVLEVHVAAHCALLQVYGTNPLA